MGQQPRAASARTQSAGQDTILAGIAATQAEHGKILQSILSLLSNVAGEDSDDLSQLLQALVARLGDQTAMLASIGAGLEALARDLPHQLVIAIDNHMNGLDAEDAAPNGYDRS